MDLFRDDMIDICGGKNISIEESLRSIFNTDDQINKDNEKERWENFTFQALPLVAVVTILSKMQVDVRNAETDVLNLLYEQIDARSFKFNKIVATVKAPSTYVMVGNEYQASVFISATDTTQAPEIKIGNYTSTSNADGTRTYEMVGDYTTLPLDETGKGVYKARATSIGQKTWGGLITMKAPDGSLVSYPFKEEYSVGANSVVVSPTAMNVLYASIDNPLDISVPGIGSDKVRATMTNGTITRGKVNNSAGTPFPGEWKALPQNVGQVAQIIVSAEINGRQQTFQPMEFRVKPVPDPVAAFANASGEARISRDIILAQSGVLANMVDFDFDLRYTVTEFTVSINDKGFDFSETSTSNRLTTGQRGLLERLTRGKKLYIEGIKAVGPDNRPRDLAPIIITVI